MLSVIRRHLKISVLLLYIAVGISFFPAQAMAQDKPVSAAARQRILAAYHLVKDSLLTQKALPFTVNTNSFSLVSLEQARQEITKGNLQSVRTYLLHALNSEDVINNPLLYVAAKSVWIDYLISVDSFTLSYSQASHLVFFADSLKVKNSGLAYLALARASSFMNDTYAYAYKNVEKTLAVAAATNDAMLEGKAQLVAGTLARKYFYGTSGRSIPYYDKAIAAATSVRDTITIIRSLILKQDDLAQAGNMEKGLPFFEQAIRLAIRSGNMKFTSNICEGLFFKLGTIGEKDKSTEMLLYALQATKRFGMVQTETHMYLQLSEMYSTRKMYDSSLFYLNQSTPPTTMVPGAKTPQFFKADVYYAMGHYKQAAELYHAGVENYLKAYIVHGQDELNRWETTLRMQEKEAEIKQNEARRKQLIWGITAIAAILIITLLALFWQRSLRKRLAAQNLLISRQSQKLEQSLADKDILLREIHHRVKNNLQVIDSLLNMHQASAELPASQQESFIKARTHVHTISMIHQNLYQQDQLSAVSMRSFVSELFTQTKTMFNKTGQAVMLDNQIPEEMKLDIDTAVPLGLILNELLTNAFKYVLPTVEQMHLSLSIVKDQQPNHYIMHYGDNGPGLPPHFDIKQNGSMGMHLIRQLSRQIGGRASYSFKNGSRFDIHFLTLEGRKERD